MKTECKHMQPAGEGMQSLENLLVGNKSQIHTLLKRWTDCFASQIPCDHFVNIDGLLINLNSVISWFTDDLKFRLSGARWMYRLFDILKCNKYSFKGMFK